MRVEDRIRSKLAQGERYPRYLVEPRPALLRPEVDFVTWGAVERSLHLALEYAIDVRETVIPWKCLERPQENRDVFPILGKAGLVEPALAERLLRAAGLRNLRVHQYGPLDRDRLRRIVLGDPGDLEEFARFMARLLTS